MKIDFTIIPHRSQRYNTIGDWYQRRGVWAFRVSKFTDPRYSWLVFAHELIEWIICRLSGISEKSVSDFDKKYEASRSGERAPCGCKHIDDGPGGDVHAPYHHAHMAANKCERILAEALNVDWVEYGEAADKVYNKWPGV